MSDAAADYPARLNLAELVARIERQQEETRNFVAEQSKLTAETSKCMAEQSKLLAETDKLRRDRFLAPALALAATLGAIATLAPTITRALGGH